MNGFVCGKDNNMDKKESLTNEWKDTVYNIGGALYGLGKVVCKSVKVGVDKVYDAINENDNAAKKTSEKIDEE